MRDYSVDPSVIHRPSGKIRSPLTILSGHYSFAQLTFDLLMLYPIAALARLVFWFTNLNGKWRHGQRQRASMASRRSRPVAGSASCCDPPREKNRALVIRDRSSVTIGIEGYMDSSGCDAGTGHNGVR